MWIHGIYQTVDLFFFILLSKVEGPEDIWLSTISRLMLSNTYFPEGKFYLYNILLGNQFKRYNCGDSPAR